MYHWEKTILFTSPSVLTKTTYTWSGIYQNIDWSGLVLDVSRSAISLFRGGRISTFTIFWIHDDVIRWKHFPRNWPFVRGIHRGPVNSPHKWPVTQSFDVFFDLRLNKRLSKQSWGWWFETLSRPLWRHRNVFVVYTRTPTSTYEL